jgi:hypothetical protein
MKLIIADDKWIQKGNFTALQVTNDSCTVVDFKFERHYIICLKKTVRSFDFCGWECWLGALTQCSNIASGVYRRLPLAPRSVSLLFVVFLSWTTASLAADSVRLRQSESTSLIVLVLPWPQLQVEWWETARSVQPPEPEISSSQWRCMTRSSDSGLFLDYDTRTGIQETRRWCDQNLIYGGELESWTSMTQPTW